MNLASEISSISSQNSFNAIVSFFDTKQIKNFKNLKIYAKILKSKNRSAYSRTLNTTNDNYVNEII